MKKNQIICCLVLLCSVVITRAQDLPIREEPGIRRGLLHGEWPANWITCPGVSTRAYGVYHFRKTFVLPEAPARFIIHLSADNRYRLFVNGKAVCSGPARSDLAHWNFETIDIAPFLQSRPQCIGGPGMEYGVIAWRWVRSAIKQPFLSRGIRLLKPSSIRIIAGK